MSQTIVCTVSFIWFVFSFFNFCILWNKRSVSMFTKSFNLPKRHVYMKSLFSECFFHFVRWASWRASIRVIAFSSWCHQFFVCRLFFLQIVVFNSGTTENCVCEWREQSITNKTKGNEMSKRLANNLKYLLKALSKCAYAQTKPQALSNNGNEKKNTTLKYTHTRAQKKIERRFRFPF